MVAVRTIVIGASLAAALLASAASAHAGSKLEEARRAIEEVQYDRAQELLGEALRAGGNTPQQVTQIYTLAASTAVVLGKTDLAEQFYRRLLELEPSAQLDADVAPKFKKPFAAAQAYVGAHGALRATAARAADGSVEVTVESDPLTMVAAVAWTQDMAHAIALGPSRRAVLPPASASSVSPAATGADNGAAPTATSDGAGAAPTATIALVDELGNQLVTLAAPAAVAKAAPERLAPNARAETSAATTSVARTWWSWAIPAGVAAAVGVGAGISASSASSDLDALLERGQPFYSDAETLRKRYQSRTTLANVSFAAAGGFAIVAGIMWFTRPHRPDRTALAPMVTSDGTVGVMLSGALR
jgi:hypothetical protein